MKKKLLTLLLAAALVGTQAIPAMALEELSAETGEAETIPAEEPAEVASETSAEEVLTEGEDEPGLVVSVMNAMEVFLTGDENDPAEEEVQTSGDVAADDEKTEDSEENAEDSAYGVYAPDSFNFTGGTGKVTITCPALKYSEEGFLAKIVFSSKYYRNMRINEVEYQAVINETAGTSTFIVPITPNEDNTIVATTYAMSEPHDVEYVINAAWTEESARSDEAFENGSEENNGEEKPEEDDSPAAKLADGTYKVLSDTDNRMFYILADSKGKKYTVLVKKEGKLQITMALTGTGYDALYLGTIEDAEKAPKSKWVKYKEDKGYYTYTFEIPELDKELQIAAHSKNRNQWYQHTVIFKSKNAIKVKEGTSAVPVADKNQNSSRPSKPTAPANPSNSKPADNKQEKPSASTTDSNKGTSVVDSSTGLADGVYALDSFSWSGGTGRLAYIRCTKLTVTGGQAYATIEFGSSSYDQLKANGRVYMKSGSGLSTFTIPVELNANNTIVGRSVAMSQPHWISYTIYPYLAEAESASSGEKGTSGEKAAVVNSNKLTDKAPEIPGLKFKSETKVEYAECFRIYNYEKGVRLIQIDLSKNSALKYKKKDINQADDIEYDDDGKPIARSQAEITEELYHSNVVNYLLVPEKVEVPAGLDKEMIIVNLPADKTYTASKMAVKFIGDLEKSKKIQIQGHYLKTEYKDIIKEKINLAIFSGMIIPEKTDEKAKEDKKLAEAEKERIKEQKAELEKVEKRFATLGIPFIVDRSGAEESKLAKAEWVKVYGAIYGCQKEAKAAFKEAKKTLEKEGKIENEK